MIFIKLKCFRIPNLLGLIKQMLHECHLRFGKKLQWEMEKNFQDYITNLLQHKRQNGFMPVLTTSIHDCLEEEQKKGTVTWWTYRNSFQIYGITAFDLTLCFLFDFRHFLFSWIFYLWNLRYTCVYLLLTLNLVLIYDEFHMTYDISRGTCGNFWCYIF